MKFRKSTAASPDVYTIITERICSILETGVIPWRKPWQSDASGSLVLPSNKVSGKAYRGINVFLLSCAGFDCPYWVSFKQAVSLGGTVKKGQKGFPVVFWKRLNKTDKKTGTPIIGANGKPESIMFLRYYTVFNLEQCEGIAWNKPESVVKPIGWEPLTEAARIASEMPNAPTLSHGGTRACYSPALDLVKMPEQTSFPVPADYYSTLFHELTHSTGHKDRLARKGVCDPISFGSDPYAQEELVAEMGASFLCGQAGILHTTLQNSAAYVANWLKALKGDSKLVVMAAAQAHKAADLILGVGEQVEATEDDKTEAAQPVEAELAVA
jgi:antirestriction protein ArdC